MDKVSFDKMLFVNWSFVNCHSTKCCSEICLFAKWRLAKSCSDFFSLCKVLFDKKLFEKVLFSLLMLFDEVSLVLCN
jgi:hypothetical protein